MASPQRWTEREDAIIRAVYPTKGAKACADMLGRTESACAVRAKRIGVKCTRRRGRHHVWTKEEDRMCALKLAEVCRLTGLPVTSVATHMVYLVRKSMGGVWGRG